MTTATVEKATTTRTRSNNKSTGKATEKAKPAAVETPKETPESKPAVTPIVDRVKSSEIVKITLGDLRDELGHSRIGRNVLASIADHLTENNLGCFPAWVVNPFENTEIRQWQEIWVYMRDGSAKSAVLDAFADPDNNDLVSALNMFSDGTPDFKNMDDAQRLAFVRAAVCQ